MRENGKSVILSTKCNNAADVCPEIKDVDHFNIEVCKKFTEKM
jgi:hypothetical protein